ncbi:hypothetical protein HKD37_19G053954 [Glycine soja]
MPCVNATCQYLSVDFLYGKYRGTLLMTTSQDENSGVLPLAFAVVEGETLTMWSWFLAHLREHVTDKNGICLISDRHTSIKYVVANKALGWQPPRSYHVYYVRHIASNFNRKFNNAKQKEMLKKLAYTPCKHIFLYQNLEKFRQLSPAIATWIDRISKEKWTMAYDREGRRYGHMTTNLSKCINKVLKDCHNIPITALVKSTYSRCRKYFVDRGRQVQRQLNEGQIYCSKLVKELRKNQEQVCSHIVRVYDIHSIRFEVEETFNPIMQRGGQKWTVNLNGHHCQCGRYFALHYPSLLRMTLGIATGARDMVGLDKSRTSFSSQVFHSLGTLRKITFCLSPTSGVVQLGKVAHESQLLDKWSQIS